MNNLLKTSVGCLFIALGLNAAFTLAQDTMQTEIPYHLPPWLQMNVHKAASRDNLRPESTVIITTARPEVKKIREKCWQISFTP
jgi:hypothetical protein